MRPASRDAAVARARSQVVRAAVALPGPAGQGARPVGVGQGERPARAALRASAGRAVRRARAAGAVVEV